ncbi:CIC11C00000001826 [Sungouiella intermedia]|uniref:CIC11C00000001826 n=1 Tax=Sungouiella intermedia TaxID=45354 RepID=A0A1L0DNS8_9ASCO|nr:CIC11C00000001826 [[Candida] intermedia]
MRSFSLERFKNKVARRSSEPSILQTSKSTGSDRRNSIANPTIVISDPDTASRAANSRLRTSSLSLVTPSNRSRLRSVSKKQAKELIRQETSLVILKKLANVLSDLGLQLPIPLKSSSGSGQLKLIKLYVANSNDCIYLAPASSASFTYEDVENGGNDIPEDLLRGDSNTSTQGGSSGMLWMDSEDPTDTNSFDSGRMSDTDVEDRTPGPPDESTRRLRAKMESFHLPNYLCTQIDSDSPIPHLFAVIVDLKKECQVKTVNILFLSGVSTLWPILEPHNRYNQKERFKIGSLEWVVSMHDADYYISTTNSNDTRHRDLTPEHLARRTRKYKLASVRNLAEGTDATNHDGNPVFVSQHLLNSDLEVNTHSSAPESFPAGIYVFLLPILLPPHIPASINSVNGCLNHRLSVLVNKISEKLNRKVVVNALFNLHMARTPPSLANSIADKPIYVNRVWNDALHYVITFPRKYISLGSEHTINVKLVPLVKDVIIKRIKFNVLERITYVSRDLSREYDYDGEDPFLARSLNSKNRERVVAICELKTKHKASSTATPEPYKEEVIKCPENNILYSCYETNNNADKTVMVASPLDINIALPFLTTRSDKGINLPSQEEPGDLDLRRTFTNSSRRSSTNTTNNVRKNSAQGPMCPSSPIIGALETHISHMNEEQLLNGELSEDVLELDSSLMAPDEHSGIENLSQGYTTTARALAPDSNFRHIQISHRLQVCFRISKPDPADNFRMHHYEVVVDTPLILLSAKCNDESIQLPHYDEIDVQTPPPQSRREISFRMPTYNNSGVSIKPLGEFGDDQLPSFEEAISASASPIMRSISLVEDQISRMNSLTPSDPTPAYERNPNVADEVIPPLSIDDLVIDPKKVTNPRRQSAIKSSLLNSFAPNVNPLQRDNATISTVSSSKSTTSSGTSTGTTGTGDKSYSDASPSIPSLASIVSDLDSTSNATSAMSTLDSSSEAPELHTPTVGQSLADCMTEEQEQESDTEQAPSRLVDDSESIITQESQFVQKLPLLQNISQDNVQNETCYANTTNENLTKLLTDTLNDEVQSPSTFHAY